MSAYLVPVDALQRGLDLRLRERGVDGVGQRGHSRDVVRLSAGARERRVFERADRGSGTPARRGRVEGVAGNAAERVKTHHLDGRGAPRPRSFSGAGGLCEPSTSGVRFSTRFLSSSVNDFDDRARARDDVLVVACVSSAARQSQRRARVSRRPPDPVRRDVLRPDPACCGGEPGGTRRARGGARRLDFEAEAHSAQARPRGAPRALGGASCGVGRQAGRTGAPRPRVRAPAPASSAGVARAQPALRRGRPAARRVRDDGPAAG